MAAFAAVVSLHHTINGLIKSSFSRVSSSAEIFLEFANKEASSLLQALEGLNGSNRSRSSMERVDALEAQIRDAAHKLEDALEFHEMKQLEEEKVEDGDEEGAMRKEIRSFGRAAKRLVKEYLAELSRDDDEDTPNGSASYPDFGVEMIGRSSLFDTILQSDVLSNMRPDDRYIMVFLGKEGMGSRVVAKTIFENAHEAGKFERSGWARVGPGYEVKHVLMSLIAQVEAEVDNESLVDASDDRLSEHLYKALENRSYMIVLDGVDDVELLDYLRTKSFPDESNGSVVLVTTTSWKVYLHTSNMWYSFVIPKVYEEEMWLYTRHVLFGWEPIDAELEVAGKEIIHNTRRLQFSLAKTLVFLSESDKTVEQWSKLAADRIIPFSRLWMNYQSGLKLKKRCSATKVTLLNQQRNYFSTFLIKLKK